MSELFDAVDALVASRAPLPPAQERKRLRQAHGLTLDDVATALKVRRATVSGWESVKKTTEPRGPEREAYARLLNKLAALYPAPAAAPDPTPVAAPDPASAPSADRHAPVERTASTAPPAALGSAAARTPADADTPAVPASTAVADPVVPRPTRTAHAARPHGTRPRPASRRAAPLRGSRTDRSRSSTSMPTAGSWRTAPAAWSWTCPPSPFRPWWNGR
jgi:transcriptional regulator with XRE-family HTH domain